MSTFIFKAASDQVICKSCLRHVGDSKDKLALKNQDHLGLWKSEIELVRHKAAAVIAAHKEKVRRAEAEVARVNLENQGLRKTLEQGFSAAAPADVQRILRSAEVKAAEERTESAYRSRDHAYRGLWAVNELHHPLESQPDKCSCGLLATRCQVTMALEGIRASLYRWERSQAERSLAGRPHGLPRDHPASRGSW